MIELCSEALVLLPDFYWFWLFIQHDTGSGRNSLPQVFYKKGVRKNLAKLTGKQLCQSHSFNEVAGLRTATLLKNRLWHRCFLLNFAKFLKTPFYKTPPTAASELDQYKIVAIFNLIKWNISNRKLSFRIIIENVLAFELCQ